jgi:putative oxidoreductase
MLQRVCNIARVLLAIQMMIGGINQVIYYIEPSLFPPLHPWLKMMADSGYLIVPKLLEFTGGVLLLTNRRVLGLALLLPVIANICLFHIFLEPRNIWVAAILLPVAALASWPERQVFAVLFAARARRHGRARSMSPARSDTVTSPNEPRTEW